LVRHPVYFPRLRKTIGLMVHENKKKRESESLKGTRESIQEIEALDEEKPEELEREKVETEFLVPAIPNWVETPEVTAIKNKVIAWLSLGHPVHIIGPTGCGKTTLALSAAKELGHPTVWINGDTSVRTTDLIGGYSQIEQETVRDKYIHNVFKDKDIMRADWVDNPLTTACKYGYTLVYNEFSRTLPVANNVLLSIFQEGVLELPTRFGLERFVKVHPNFKAIFTSNSVEYAGVHRPQDALLDRLVGVYMDYYSPKTEAEIVAADSKVSDHDAKRIVKIVREVRSKMNDGEKPGTRACVMIGQAFAALKNPSQMELQSICMDVITSKTKNFDDFSKKTKIVERAVESVS